MSRACQFEFAGRSGAAEWSFDEVSLIVAPGDGRPLVFPVQELAGIAGDGYGLELAVPGPAGAAGGTTQRRLSLSKLGAEGPTLLEALQRSWLAARAKALRLGGSGEAKPFSGMVAGEMVAGAVGGAPEPFRAVLFEDVMLIAREGQDLDPLFVALTETVTFDQDAYAVRVTEWPGWRLVFSRLAKQTEDFIDSLRENREMLANEAGTVLASSVPSLPAALRGALAGDWPPGRLRTVEDLNGLCPGFEQALRETWLPGCVRRQEAEYLLEWAGSAGSWLGCSRETTETGEGLLWLLAGKNGTWFLEALTGEDRATYHFAGTNEMPPLVSRLLCAPQFSKEALYAPLEMLTGDRADLAIAAQFLSFLVDLRARFKDRVIHVSPEGWRADMEAITAG
jgi:hypothetical protein